MGWLAVAYAVSLVGYLAVNVCAARWLGIDDYGRFLVVTTVAFVIGQVALFGAHRAGLREVSKLPANDGLALTEVGREGAAVLWLAVPAVAAASGIVYVLLASDGIGGDGHAVVAVGVELALLVWANAVQRMGASYLRGLGRLATASFLDGSAGGAMTLCAQGLLLGAGLVVRPGASLSTVLALMVLGYLPSLIISLHLLRHVWWGSRPELLFGSLRTGLRRYRAFAVIQVAGYAGSSLEIWLAALALTATQASYFGAAQRLALMYAVPLMALQAVASPAISRGALGSGAAVLESALRTSATFALLAAGLFALPVFVRPGQVLQMFFGATVPGFGLVLVLLVLSQLVNVATGMCGPVLTMTRYEGSVAVVTSGALGLRAVVGVPAALAAGPLGLALSSMTISAACWLYLVVEARRRCDINTLPTWRPSLEVLRLVRG
jgi:O-antigen/teichoic acid export membrane protein